MYMPRCIELVFGVKVAMEDRYLIFDGGLDMLT